jgi:hypothetical protein
MSYEQKDADYYKDVIKKKMQLKHIDLANIKKWQTRTSNCHFTEKPFHLAKFMPEVHKCLHMNP